MNFFDNVQVQFGVSMYESFCTRQLHNIHTTRVFWGLVYHILILSRTMGTSTYLHLVTIFSITSGFDPLIIY